MKGIKYLWIDSFVRRKLFLSCILQQNFYYQISWQHPKPTGTRVLRYRIKITYHLDVFVCFQVPAHQTTFMFNESMGLLYGCIFNVYVTAQPVSHASGSNIVKSIQVFGCPVPPKLLPLPNIVVQLGRPHSFTAIFKYDPVPTPVLNWYFSPERVYCRNESLISRDREGVFISENRHTLTIRRVSRNDLGCYIVKADNGIGRVVHQRGYINIDHNKNKLFQRLVPSKTQQTTDEYQGPLFGSLAGIMIFLLFCIFFLKCYKRSRFNVSKTPPDDYSFVRKVYLSHCAESRQEKHALSQFVCALKKFGIDVIVDVFSQVNINQAYSNI